MDFHKRSDSRDGYRNDCKSCNINRVSVWANENKEYCKERSKKYYLDNAEILCKKSRDWRKNNPEKAKESDRIKTSKRCKVAENLRFSIWRKNNKHKVNSNSSYYRNKKTRSSLYNVHKIEIYTIYDNCPKGYQVDHIIPITNKLISGLHVPWNLQYLPKKENKFKSNKFDGTYKNNSWRNG
jgi:hypothetical protein